MDRKVKVRFFEPYVIAEELNYDFFYGTVEKDKSGTKDILTLNKSIYINGDYNNAFIIKPKDRGEVLFDDIRSGPVVVSCIPMKPPEVWEDRMYLMGEMWTV